MNAVIGDEIVIDTETLGAPPRRGRVLQVLRTAGEEHYRVGWADGRESMLFPGPDAHLAHEGGDRAGRANRAVTMPARVALRARRWTGLTPGDQVRCIMAAQVVEIDAQASLREVTQALSFAEVGALIVVDGRATLGVMSERDVIRTLALGADPDGVWAADMVAPETVWGNPRDTIRAVARLMWEAEVRHIPLREGSTVVGMVSIRDVLAVLFQSPNGR